jgi:hypothetical protein
LKARAHLAGMSSQLDDTLAKNSVPIVHGVVKPNMLLVVPAGYLVCEAASQVNLGIRISFCASFGPKHTLPLQNLEAIAKVLSAGVLKDSMEAFLATALAEHAAQAHAAQSVPPLHPAGDADGALADKETGAEKAQQVEGGERPEQATDKQQDTPEGAEVPEAAAEGGEQAARALQNEPKGAESQVTPEEPEEAAPRPPSSMGEAAGSGSPGAVSPDGPEGEPLEANSCIAAPKRTAAKSAAAPSREAGKK